MEIKSQETKYTIGSQEICLNFEVKKKEGRTEKIPLAFFPIPFLRFIKIYFVGIQRSVLSLPDNFVRYFQAEAYVELARNVLARLPPYTPPGGTT